MGREGLSGDDELDVGESPVGGRLPKFPGVQAVHEAELVLVIGLCKRNSEFNHNPISPSEGLCVEVRNVPPSNVQAKSSHDLGLFVKHIVR